MIPVPQSFFSPGTGCQAETRRCSHEVGSPVVHEAGCSTQRCSHAHEDDPQNRTAAIPPARRTDGAQSQKDRTKPKTGYEAGEASCPAGAKKAESVADGQGGVEEGVQTGPAGPGPHG